MTQFVPADERPHRPEITSAWTESWEWRLVVDDASLALSIAVIHRPADARVAYVMSVLGRGRLPIVVVEHDIAAPRDGGLELRASGIWADHVCETPFEHWSLGLEAFGLTLDDPDDAIGLGRGIRTPVGLDTEWEDAGPPVPLADGSGYLVAGRAHGEVLVGIEEHDVDGAGHRLHRWGTGARLPGWWSHGSDCADTQARPDPRPGQSGAPVARAVADDGAGRIVDWVLWADREGSAAPPILVSTHRP